MLGIDSFEMADTLLPFLWLAWMVITPAGPILGWLTYKRWPKCPHLIKIRIVSVSATLLISSLLLTLSHWSLRSITANSLLVALGYLSLFELTWITARAKPRWLTAFAPIASTGFAIIVAIVVYTGLGFLFAVGEMLPTRNIQLGHHLILRVTETGGATAAHNSATLIVAKQSPWTPGIEHMIYQRYVRDDECESYRLHLSIDDGASSEEIFCGQSVIDHFTFHH